MNNQIVFLAIMAVFIGGVLLFSKERLKALLAVVIIITPWQGGLWLEYFAQDLLLSTILYILIALLILFSKKRRRMARVNRRLHWPVLLPAIGMLVGAAISVNSAIDPFSARSGIMIIFERYLAFFCVYNLIEKPSDLKVFIIAIAASLLFESLLGLVQFRFMTFRIGVIDADQGWQTWRARGTFFHPNALGMYLLVLLIPLYRFVLLAMKKKSVWMQPLLLGTYALGLVALMATQNRGSWIGFVAGMLILLFIDLAFGRTRVHSVLGKLAVPVLVVVLFLGIKYGGFVYYRLFQDDMTEQIEGRKELEKSAHEVIRRHPAFGVGWGNYQLHVTTTEFTHNLFLLVISELGFVGLFFFVWFLCVWLWEIIQCWRSGNVVVRNLGAGGLGALIGFLIASIPGPDYMIIRQVGTHIWIVVGMVAGLNKVSQKYNMRALNRYAQKRRLKEDEIAPMRNRLLNEWKGVV